MADDSLIKRLEQLEKRVLPKAPKPEEPTVSLLECNRRSYETEKESREERMSALGIATDALKAAFEPSEKARRAAAKVRKPLSAQPGSAQK